MQNATQNAKKNATCEKKSPNLRGADFWFFYLALAANKFKFEMSSVLTFY